jgi:hypothetical protein
MSSKACFRTQVAAVLLIVTIGALGGPALARSPDERKWRKACTADAFSHCPLQALAADRDGVRDCLVRKIDKLSDVCATVIRDALRPQLTVTVPSTAR